MKEFNLAGLVEAKVWRIFKTFLDNPQKIFHLNSVAQSSQVPVSSAQRLVKKLAKAGFLESLAVGKLSLYRLAENEKTERLRKFVYGR